MSALHRERRWLAFTLFVVVMVALCLALSRWQWHRYEQRRAENARLDAALSAPAVPLPQLVAPTSPDAPAQELSPDLQWRTVSVAGQFAPAGEVAVRRRPLDGRTGFWILTPLVTDSGVVLVNRGWAPSGADALSGPDMSPPPTGIVTVTGRLRAAEGQRSSEEPPAGQAWSVDPATTIAADPALADLPRYDAFVELRAAQPAASDGLVVLTEDPGHVGWNNLVYSVQWVIFAVIGVVGAWRLMRQESAHGVGAEGTAEAPVVRAEPGPPR